MAEHDGGTDLAGPPAPVVELSRDGPIRAAGARPHQYQNWRLPRLPEIGTSPRIIGLREPNIVRGSQQWIRISPGPSEQRLILGGR